MKSGGDVIYVFSHFKIIVFTVHFCWFDTRTGHYVAVSLEKTLNAIFLIGSLCGVESQCAMRKRMVKGSYKLFQIETISLADKLYKLDVEFIVFFYLTRAVVINASEVK